MLEAAVSYDIVRKRGMLAKAVIWKVTPWGTYIP